MALRAYIASTGLHLPPRVQTNAELSSLVGRSEAWMRLRTGVLERRIAEEPVEVLGARAARAALGDGAPPDLIINASLSPRQLVPDTSVFLQEALGYSGIPSFSMHATCLSFLPALHYAAMAVHAGAHERVLVVSAEAGTPSRNLAEPESAVLIGDGAGAVVVERAPVGGAGQFLGWRMKTWPEASHLTQIEGAGLHRHPNDPDTRPEHNLFHMEGPGIYRFARTRVGPVVDELLGSLGLTIDDIDLLVPHQASGPALEAMRLLGISAEKTVNIIEKTGNCIAASLPMALASAAAEGRLQRGQTILMVGTGAGLSIGAAALVW